MIEKKDDNLPNVPYNPSDPRQFLPEDVNRAVEVGDLNGDGIISLSPDGRSIAYSKKNNRSVGWFGDPIEGGYQLLIASRTATGEWGEPNPFPFVEKATFLPTLRGLPMDM